MMRLFAATLCLAFLLPAPGSSVHGRHWLAKTVSQVPLPLKVEWKQWNQQAFSLIQQRRYRDVVTHLESKLAVVQRYEVSPNAVYTLNCLGSAYLALYQQDKALRVYLRARQAAQQLQSWEFVSYLSHNISNLYLSLSDLEQARLAAEEGIRSLPAAIGGNTRARMLLHLARLRSREGKLDEAKSLFSRAIEEADRAGDSWLHASGLEYLGRELMGHQDFPGAEDAFLRALRIRVLAHDPGVSSSYQCLAELRLRQHQPADALRLAEHALYYLQRGGNRQPEWEPLYYRARALSMLGRNKEALQDLRLAIEKIQLLGLHVVPADRLRVSSGQGVQRAYAEFVEAASQLYLSHPNPAYLTESLEISEQVRALALRQSLAEQERLSRILPGEYYETLARLQQVFATRAATSARGEEISNLRRKMLEMEASAGLSGARSPANGQARGPWQDIPLPPSTLLLVFHCGSANSYLWMVQGKAIQLRKLPGAAILAEKVSQFRRAVWDDPGKAEVLGETIYSSLFGDSASRSFTTWFIVADGPLHQLPFSALVKRRVAGQPVFLAEEHAVVHLPGIWAARPAASEYWSGPALAVADPIYNNADARRTSTLRQRALGVLGSWTGRAAAGPMPLSRLPGSLAEIQVAAPVWQAATRLEPVQLTGQQASIGQLERRLESKPSLLHFATHVVPFPKTKDSFLALSIDESGLPQLLSAEWITSRRVACNLVMMSGCSSGAGDTAAAEGLLGLTRAWLLAGTGAVAATHWPVTDDGGMVALFYQHWGRLTHLPPSLRAARALQSAQTGMIRSQSFRSSPRYWASYFVSGISASGSLPTSGAN